MRHRIGLRNNNKNEDTDLVGVGDHRRQIAQHTPEINLSVTTTVSKRNETKRKPNPNRNET